MANPRKTGRTPQQNQRQRPGQVEKLNVVQDIISFRNQIRELARPNLFQVEINFPAKVEEIFQVNSADVPESQNNSTGNAEGARLSTFLVKAANLPASTVGVVEVPFRGRTLKIAGDRTFEPWTVTVMNDENFLLRRKLEEWSRTIQSMPMNYQTATSIAEYQSNALVRQFDRQGAHSAAYEFVGIWPSNISAIDLAWDSNDTPEEYTVEFQVQYWTYASDVNTGNSESTD